MATAVYAGLWSTIAASSLVLGAFLAEQFKVAGALVGPAMGFGAGALISALAYELIPDARVSDIWVWLAFAVGALLYYGLDSLIERRLATAGLSIVLGALLDGIPESMVLGLGIAVGGSVSIGFLVAVFVSNVPESLSATVDLRNSHTAAWVYRLWLAIVLVSGLAGAFGVLAAEHLPTVDGRYVQAFAAGAVLTMIADSMMPEAFHRGGRPIALLTALGFAIAAVLTLLD
jgi:zinc transporter, ZIP family